MRRVRDVNLLPASIQRPRPPVWIGGFWPHRRPMRCAVRWDGVVPLFETARHGQITPLAEAGATSWDERNLQTGPDFDRLTPVRRRINEGPPAL
jgi:hypothetical protein